MTNGGWQKHQTQAAVGGGLKLSKKAFVHKLLFKTFLEISLQCKGVAAKKMQLKKLEKFWLAQPFQTTTARLARSAKDRQRKWWSR